MVTPTPLKKVRRLIFFMAEYGSMFAVSGIATIMFLGGWRLGLGVELADVLEARLGILGLILGNVVNVIVFIFKCWFLVFVMMWVRWTLPRLRIDQVMMTCLKYLLPISCALLLGVSFWEVLLGPNVGPYFKYVAFAACFVLGLWVIYKVVTRTPSKLPTAVPALWNVKPDLARK